MKPSEWLVACLMVGLSCVFLAQRAAHHEHCHIQEKSHAIMRYCILISDCCLWHVRHLGEQAPGGHTTWRLPMQQN